MTRNHHDDVVLTDFELEQVAAIHQTLAGSDPELVARLDDDNDRTVSPPGTPRRERTGADHATAPTLGNEQELRLGRAPVVSDGEMGGRRRTPSEEAGTGAGDTRLLSFALVACMALFWVTLVSVVLSARSRSAAGAALAAGVAGAWWLCLRLARAIVDEPRPSGSHKD